MLRGPLTTRSGQDKYAYGAPVLKGITVCDLLGQPHPESWDAVVDTGADRSVVPLQVCQTLKLPVRFIANAKGADRSESYRNRPLYLVRLVAPGMGDVTVTAWGLDRGNVLLGRDVLTKLQLLFLFDGYASRWGLHHSTWGGRLVLRAMQLA